MKKETSKEKVKRAASLLFFTKGYAGTSIRDIASKANVNVSLISYHFKNKQGLLEYLMIQYFEPYLEMLVTIMDSEQENDPKKRFKHLIEAIIQYKQEHHQFTCFVHRELTLDNMFVREMMVTYLAKEKFYLSKAFKEAIHPTTLKASEKNYLFLQLKGMLTIPYLMPHDMMEEVSWNQSHEYFVRNYVATILSWMEHVYLKGTRTPKEGVI
ncbi:TetR family transcriptional regulator [Pontibacillus halophilus JSM 076056 = DSM 19796]|uniref:TetR family transcriptional regulator n=1 Tax=Pontibacillus halophilus JSM 076056 = DSM 19796 TaxID=1385510 RepID=A0A0A5GJA8_9BACI|nr:forespore capture DNA-binding protein RefZ [Pontibacillus halophilus]KGX93341.1 TetR family transcriptional regulator [Pontibacillus halophilus JSM 076056 = DSM 19796]